MVLVGGVFGRWLINEGGALIPGISAFIKETPQNFLVPSAMGGYKGEVGSLEEHSYHAGPWSWLSAMKNFFSAVTNKCMLLISHWLECWDSGLYILELSCVAKTWIQVALLQSRSFLSYTLSLNK